MSGIDWDQVWREQQGRKPNVYQKHTCIICGRQISESAYSGEAGNLKKHVRSCEKKRKKKES